MEHSRSSWTEQPFRGEIRRRKKRRRRSKCDGSEIVVVVVIYIKEEEEKKTGQGKDEIEEVLLGREGFRGRRR